MLEPTEGYKLAWELLRERFGNNDIANLDSQDT